MAFWGYFYFRFYLLVGVVFGAVFRLVFCLFWPRAKNAEDRNSIHLPCENLVFQGARPRRRSPKDDNKPLQKSLNKGSKKCEKTLNIVDFSASRGRPPKIPPKRASRAPSGELPGTPRRLQEAPRALQDGSKSLQERSKRLSRGFSRASASKMRLGTDFGPVLDPRK